MRGRPVQRPFGILRIDFIAQIMAGPIPNEGDQPLARAIGAGQPVIDQRANGFDNIDIPTWLLCADAIARQPRSAISAESVANASLRINNVRV